MHLEAKSHYYRQWDLTIRKRSLGRPSKKWEEVVKRDIEVESNLKILAMG